MNNEKKFIKLTPFKMQVLQSFPFIDEDFDAITNYELLCKVVEYLNKTIANVDLLNSKVEEFEQYFDNLDVQDEINNKLDEMAESGELTDIIAQYLNLAGMLTYSSVASLKSASNIANGSTCQTLGYYNSNDGGGAIYKVRTITNVDVVDDATIISLSDNSLIAELIIGNKIHTKQFGCYADNTHDDTANIQKAINYACNHNGILLFDDGKYLVSDTLTIPSAIKIEGCYAKGDSTTSIKGAEIYMSASNKTIFEFASGVSFYQCEIKDIRLNCDSNANNCIGIDTSKATLVSECIFDSVYINGNFSKGMKLAKTTISTFRNCIFSSNTVGMDISTSAAYLYIENCNFWNNGNDISATGSLQHIYITKCHFENTLTNTNIVYKAPISLYNSAIQNCDFLSVNSNYAILFDGSNSSDYVRTDGFCIENCSIASKTGIKIDMTSNTSSQNSLNNTYIKDVTFLRNTNYGIDTNYQYTYFVFIDCICYNNWYYGSGTLVNRTTSNYIRVISFKDGIDVDSTLNFSYVSSNFYKANSLYLDSSNTLKWRFNDTSKTAPVAMVQAGGSTSRPSSPVAGQMYYDWTIGKPIWFNGTNWIDATGKQV